MKRVRTKETIENNRKLSKKQDESDESHPFPSVPLDLIFEILLKVPAKSIARFFIVSKQWLSIISSKDFTNLYLTQSSTRPRLLFSVSRHFMQRQQQFLQSCSQQDPSSDHHRVYISTHPSHIYAFSPPVRGLICRQNDTQVMIGNPTTGQFLTLPRVKSRRRGLFSFFGYDPVNDVYKVLCMTVLRGHQIRGSRYVSEEHQVFTLGAKQRWRKIECKHPHLLPSFTKGVCISGVVYYYAWIKLYGGSLISFDLGSEEFSVIRLPRDLDCLVNYNGKIALTSQRKNRFNGTLTLDILVLEDANKQKWSKVWHLVPSWKNLVGNLSFGFKGTLSSGELIFAPLSPIIKPVYLSSPITNPVYLIIFDPNKNKAQKVVVEGVGDDFDTSLEVYLDHIEIPMFLSNVS